MQAWQESAAVHSVQGETQLRHCPLLRYLSFGQLVHLAESVISHYVQVVSQVVHVLLARLRAKGVLQDVHLVADCSQRSQLVLQSLHSVSGADM